MTPGAEFVFDGRWWLAADPDRVQRVLVDLEHYPAWWPQVRAVAKVSDDDALVVCRSVLPYDLDLHLHAVHREPRLLEIEMSGDLKGRARFALAEVDGGTRLDFAQEVVVGHAGLRAAARVLRPALVWNHQRMMASCVTGLARRTGAAAVDSAQRSIDDMSE